ncbi:MAG: aquaporin [Flavobacterium lindanitolerans]|jgi:aquaporin Z|uniref:aquaporin n=1 Tax=Flavobacterium lindanitolerans TaxID=428988 RepID=UPI001A623049|nr:aquaporin [Flavobacterium lindanitolerans]MBL7867501.1 aquaporin [Flavobacterium lindanitolerans]
MSLPTFASGHKKMFAKVQLASILAEFAGTFLLTFFVVAGMLIPFFQDNFFNQLLLCLSIGTLTFLATFFFYPISGSHYNPAISVGFFIANRIGFNRLIAYTCMHVAGGILATFLGFYLFSQKAGTISGMFIKPTVLGYEEGLMLSTVCQSVLMFIVLLLFLGLTYLKKSKLYVASIMAITVFMANFVNMSITNYPLNPAITAAELLIYGNHGSIEALSLWLSPFAGAGLAGIIYYITFIRPIN